LVAGVGRTDEGWKRSGQVCLVGFDSRLILEIKVRLPRASVVSLGALDRLDSSTHRTPRPGSARRGVASPVGEGSDDLG
jgi:hypothetical protein